MRIGNHEMTSRLATCLLQIEFAHAVELDKGQTELAGSVAQCRTAGWVQVCRDPDGSISVGRRFGAIYQLSPSGREALAAYRQAIAEAVNMAKRSEQMT